MKRNPLYCSFFCYITLLSCRSVTMLQCGEQEFEDKKGRCIPCLHCPPGQEPDKECGYGNGIKMSCRICAPATFSNIYSSVPCKPHTDCATLKKTYVHLGTVAADAVCGHCLPGYFTVDEESSDVKECLPCSSAPIGTVECAGVYSRFLRVARDIQTVHQEDISKFPNKSKKGTLEEKHTEYAVLALVPVFCIVGLLGILVCNVLKKKGYRCTSEKEADEASSTAAINGDPFTSDESNEDTIGVLVRLITEKKENAAALDEMLKEHERREGITRNMSEITNMNVEEKFAPLITIPKLCKHHHVHTVQTSATLLGSSCTRCSQKKWPELLLNPAIRNATKPVKAGMRNSRSSEITILSIGRFRVAQIPEQKQNLIDEKVLPAPEDTGSMEMTCDEPTDCKALLSSVSIKCPKYSASQQEVGD
ncbi:tumor necrosis factor receptor superfamily member 19L [Scyliorhinus canicula]|uniref:tumor necrosis factor receptor superfamily member 19L n=1 Tax=Scyliorhinus canicula TaxID=7830 RepID=UPI0018F63150|nr:tumor necrosis factor receptor superfamily member 19L [Scyliorhinus canicula]XP_038674438.1 tumor necrosis factor receptor superfamily member 19L [Scyliorhinus canicula]XP_038674439.1 tumor necrosis factor receptor superfamily member 19L [Scyliorhinus canicula]XP_038674440.1 tumor necrosis factor receptor superfamily member 19L [Scyliorhinus canicula]